MMIDSVMVIGFMWCRYCDLAIDYTGMLRGALDFIVTFIAV
ncbi:MAG TPA: hypothetical protein VND94_23710 [Terriglobia bacterium]|nr:hypothetical protein [Terriglobia bacterium]